MDAVAGAILVELAKGLLQVFFALLQKAGVTSEEIEAIYILEKNNFIQNKPDLLPDV